MVQSPAGADQCVKCVFKGTLSEDCEFEFWRRWRSSMWVPRDCPRGIPRDANWRTSQRRARKKYKLKRRTRPLNEFELQVLDAMRTHPSNFGLKYQQVINLSNGRRVGKRSSKYININTAKRMISALQALRVRGLVRAGMGRWFLSDARGVGESNRGVRA